MRASWLARQDELLAPSRACGLPPGVTLAAVESQQITLVKNGAETRAGSITLDDEASAKVKHLKD